MLYNYTFANRKRDLSDVMATVIKDEPRFISNFRTAPDAVSAKHEYLEDQLTGRSVAVTAIAGDTATQIVIFAAEVSFKVEFVFFAPVCKLFGKVFFEQFCADIVIQPAGVF